MYNMVLDQKYSCIAKKGRGVGWGLIFSNAQNRQDCSGQRIMQTSFAGNELQNTFIFYYSETLIKSQLLRSYSISGALSQLWPETFLLDLTLLKINWPHPQVTLADCPSTHLCLPFECFQKPIKLCLGKPDTFTLPWDPKRVGYQIPSSDSQSPAFLSPAKKLCSCTK